MATHSKGRQKWASLELAGRRSEVVYTSVQECTQRLESALWIMDVNTAPLSPLGTQSRQVVLPAGEVGKSWPAVEQILRKAVNDELDRDSVFVGLGGGVLCDMVAFAASIYLRGVEVILIPTTLLAMVDAAVGGKTGINFAGYKNIVGTFYAAGEVRIVPEMLATLPQQEYRSGLGEVIKSAVLADESFVSLLETRREAVLARDEDTLLEIIRRSVALKAHVVAQDYREKGSRAFLNLGHTFAHALESTAGFGEWTHGEAVAWGIARALELGKMAGITDPAHAERIQALLSAYGYRVEAGVADVDGLITAMRQDKKRRGDRVRFVLSRGVGDTVVESVDEATVRAVLG
ncbi:MAG: 3-dehydroquinate synthase [bacterium]